MTAPGPGPGQAAYEALRHVTEVIEEAALGGTDADVAVAAGAALGIARHALAAQEQPAPGLAAALADLESEIRDVTREVARCRSPLDPCPFCEREITRAMKAIAAYALDCAEYGRTLQPDPDPALAALRSGITGLIRELDESAAATRPSRKSDIEFETAIALRRLLEG